MPGSFYNPILLIVLYGITLLVTALGFRKVVYFVSIGYTFAIVGMGFFTFVIYYTHLTLLGTLHLAGLIYWGLRLGLFLVRRERLPGYQGERERVRGSYPAGRLGVRAAIWVSVSLLYVLLFLPGLAGAAGNGGLAWQIPGAVVMFAGLWLESTADQQKSAYKHQNPGAFCDIGLYRLVRCPNYLGEILFWTGSWLMAIPFYTDAFLWIGSLVGLVCLGLIMIGSTKRLEVTQGQRYGQDQAYQAYIRSVPVLFPFVPVYSLSKVRVYLE